MKVEVPKCFHDTLKVPVDCSEYEKGGLSEAQVILCTLNFVFKYVVSTLRGVNPCLLLGLCCPRMTVNF